MNNQNLGLTFLYESKSGKVPWRQPETYLNLALEEGQRHFLFFAV